MPSLLESLMSEDLGQLLIIAEFWGLDLHAPDIRTGRISFVDLILNKRLVKEIAESLDEEETEAMRLLIENDLRYSWKQFREKYGEIREFGAAKRDREKPHLNPISVSEKLYYLGMIHKAFFDIEIDPKETIYIPDDLAALLPWHEKINSKLMVRPAKPDERKDIKLSNDHAIDDICTIFAGMRIGFDDPQIQTSSKLSTDLKHLLSLLESLNFANDNRELNTDLVRDHLKLSRNEALFNIAIGWMESKNLNDLKHVPGLIFEGKWNSFPYKSRQAILNHLKQLQPDTWWNIQTFVSSIKKQDPEFLRQSSDYDNWYIRSEDSKEYLQGFQYWNQIEGVYLHYLINGPLFWYGFVDLASTDKDSAPVSFKLSKRANYFLSKNIHPTGTEETEKVFISSKLILDVPRLCQRAIRYHLSRFCEWDGMVRENYRYKITTSSLLKAQSLGLEVDQLLKLLQKYSSSRISKNIVKAIKRWDQKGVEATISPHLILRVHNPEILKDLKSSKAARFLGDTLSPTSVIVNAGAWEKVQEALGEIGYLAEINIPD